ncbi:MAG: mycothiol synthase, partial [Gordonia sp. (in: high G+C Gram-positive bacteria)]
MTADFASRLVHGVLAADELAAARALISAAEGADGVVPLSEQFICAFAAPDGRHVLSPHGYAGIVVSPSGSVAVEGVVDPAYRGRGEGAALLATALAEGR